MEQLESPVNPGSTQLESFFRSWEHNMSAGDISAVVTNFGEVFLYAGRNGTQAVRASDFSLAVTKRKQLFDRLRCQPTALVALTEMKLDDRFTLARAQWRMSFGHGEAAPQQFLVDSTYIVSTGESGFKIIFYLAHQDIMEILKERGILAAQTAP